MHNFYQQPGGEDQVFADETELLRAAGATVKTFAVHNSAVESMGKLTVAGKTIWNRDSADAVADVARSIQADVVHFHNTFPLISPAAYSAAGATGAAVVQTLHNYRLLCPSATLYRDGHVCEDCVHKSVAWPAVQHACYRNSRLGSAAVAGMLAVHNARGTWKKDVDAFIALTEFSRSKFIEGGIPAEQLFVKPNFVSPDPGIGSGAGDNGQPFAIFVGRLTHEKGIDTLLDAWKKIGSNLSLKILGDGPLRDQVVAAAAADPSIQYLGRRPMDEVLQQVGNARMLVFPSVWYEGLPRTIVESFARGTPVVASRLGSMAELVASGENGLLFEPGNGNDLAAMVLGSTDWNGMREKARTTFQEKYTAGPNYETLNGIYQQAVRFKANRHAGATPAPALDVPPLHRISTGNVAAGRSEYAGRLA